MVTESDLVEVLVAESVTFTGMLLVPAVVGVPLTTPVAGQDSDQTADGAAATSGSLPAGINCRRGASAAYP
jgi:hypothetical protein